MKPKIILLDGWKARKIYQVHSLREALAILKSLNVKYILTTPCTTPGDHRMPYAYLKNIISKYLSDPLTLPIVYVSSSGATVYTINYDGLEHKGFMSEYIIPKMGNILTLNVTITNNTIPPSATLYLAMPCDYRLGYLMISSETHNHNVSLELFKGIIPRNMTTEWRHKYFMVARSPPLEVAYGVPDPQLAWEISDCGYFSLKNYIMKSICSPDIML